LSSASLVLGGLEWEPGSFLSANAGGTVPGGWGEGT
jgi:hypothetical protein